MKNEHPIEYAMSKTMFNSLLATRKGDEKKKNPYVFVMEYINSTHNLRGKVTKLHIED